MNISELKNFLIDEKNDVNNYGLMISEHWIKIFKKLDKMTNQVFLLHFTMNPEAHQEPCLIFKIEFYVEIVYYILDL